jgi:5,6-dimethylbenzimidazole synthase
MVGAMHANEPGYAEGHLSVPRAVHDVILRRRDVRGEFTGEPIPAGMLRWLLEAAHAAPSVGLSQPWDFVVVEAAETRERFRAHVLSERQTFASALGSERAALFSRIKIEGICESSLGIVVTYDPTRGAPGVLGRHAIADTGVYSTCLAIENLWLAATSIGYGVGWVSFYREAFLRELIGAPGDVRPVAWLCVGPVSALHQVPDLERQGWRSRRPLDAAVHFERWGRNTSSD